MTLFKCMPYVILFLPLIGFLVLFIGRSFLSKRLAGILASSTILGAFFGTGLMAARLHDGMVSAPLFQWIQLSHFSISLGLFLDPLAILMALMITGVGFLVHLYSIGYMSNDDGFVRYFGYLNLFIFFMLLLVMSDTYLGTFLGWEGVGLCSYLLIGFWYKNHQYVYAATKAFIMNRVGDVGFILAMGLLFITFGTLKYTEIFSSLSFLQPSPLLLFVMCSFLILAVAGKSAQFPLYTWLPDAMAGPTPVSALIHAATMVTAGVYLVSRSSMLFSLSPEAGDVLVVIGVVTAIIGAVTATYQYDLKKILAYSTVSQLGFMVVALGLGSYTAALFHMLMHAFFKALLFLGAGNVIHSVDGEQDIRKMGALRKYLPVTSTYMMIGSLAIMGLPPLSGFFSKEGIVEAAMIHSKPIFGLLLFVSALTTFYMSRMIYFVFFGQPRYLTRHPHEAGITMQIPLAILAILTIVGGMLSPNHPSGIGLIATTLGIIVVFGAIGLAWARSESQHHSESTRVVSGLDAAYSRWVIAPYLFLSRVVFSKVDRQLNRSVVGAARLGEWMGSSVTRVQSGSMGLYLLLMLAAIVMVMIKIVVL